MYKYCVILILLVIILLPFCYTDSYIAGSAVYPITNVYKKYAGHIAHCSPIGPASNAAMILHCQIASLENNNVNNIVICDHMNSNIVAYTYTGNEWGTRIIYEGVRGPSHLHISDLDGDGDNDIAVASLGDLFPNDDSVGGVVILEKMPEGYRPHVLPFRLRRVTDVQPADLDNDGDMDLIVSVFGHDHGEIFWLEELGSFTYKKHVLHRAPGAIHVVIGDYDKDDDMDFAVCISQHDEEVRMFENNGAAEFTSSIIFKSLNYELGISGLYGSDIDSDGYKDLLLSCGDNLESSFHYPLRGHGCYLLRNIGGLKFDQRKIADIPGCYGLTVGDFDADGDQDIAAVTMINLWQQEGASSLVLMENDGKLDFTPFSLARDPIQMVSCASGDVTGDGKIDIITTCMHLFPPFERFGAIDVWSLNR
ncbi:MAG: VCBS repeat-containing protein [Planctomycetes bacterium]|nr:VCBS repeat-containing protein [Planctomycetota bacterium]